jgi:uncharacterized protein YutE (UPF0331/DUF86 family)
VDIERAKRYKDKLNLMAERAGDILDWTSEDVSGFISDKKTKLATYKAFQELTEASFDIAAMVCKDSGLIPKDDYTNVDILCQNGIIDNGVKDVLSQANGLRNRLVHRYNNLDDVMAFDSIRTLSSGFEHFEEVIGKWLEKNL